MRIAFARVDQHAHPVSLQAVGDPHFLAGDDVVISIFTCVAFDTGHVAASGGFAHPNAADHVARDGRGQKFGAQLVAAEACQRGGTHIGLHTNRHGDATTVDMTQSLGHGHAVGIVQARSAVGFRLTKP